MPDVGPFCITPIVSAVDLEDPEFLNQYYVLDNIDQVKNDGISRTHDYIGAYPDPNIQTQQKENQMHPFLAKTNMPYFLSYLITQNKVLELNGVLQAGETFNFGRSDATFDRTSLSIQARRSGNIIGSSLTLNGGNLDFNGQGKVGYQSNALSGNNDLNQDRDYYIHPTACNNNTLLIEALSDSEVRINPSNVATTKLSIENATIHFKDQSKLRTRSQAIIELKNNAHLIFEENTELDLSDQSIVIVEEGATLELKGATTKIFGNSSILVKEGGLLILSGQSAIQFEDISQSQSSRLIDVSGSLWIEGHHQFTGQGVVHMKPTMDVTYLQNNVSLESTSNDFIEFILDGTNFPVPNGKELELKGLNWQNISEAKFFVEGRIKAQDLSLSSEDRSPGIECSFADMIRLDNCTFSSLGDALTIQDFEGPFSSYFLLFNQLSFQDCRKAIQVSNIDDWIRMSIINIDGNQDQSNTGLILNNVEFLSLIQSDIYKLGIGVDLNKTSKFIAHDSEIRYCTKGINGILSNVFLVDQTNIHNNNVGVELEGRYELIEGVRYSDGLVYMDCASIENNNTGITGTDVLLQIDADQIAKSKRTTIVRPNYFSSISSQNLIFDIIYEDRDPAFVYATENNWGNYTPLNIPYSIIKNYPEGTSISIGIIANPFQTGSFACVNLPNPPSTETDVEMVDQSDNDGGFWTPSDGVDYYTLKGTDSVLTTNYYDFAWLHFNLDSNELLTDDFMYEFISETPFGVSNKLDHLLSVAEVFIPYQPALMQVGGRMSESHHSAKVKTYPNPFSDILTIDASTEMLSIQIYDNYGRLLRTYSPKQNSLKLTDIQALKSGVYQLKIEFEKTIYYHTLIKQ
jgi:hypothetical protein